MTDFGLSKMEVTGAGAEGGTKTFCGTPEYLAPEVGRPKHPPRRCVYLAADALYSILADIRKHRAWEGGGLVELGHFIIRNDGGIAPVLRYQH